MAVAPAPPVERFQSLIARLESVDDVEARELAEELLATMLELYGEGFERIVRALDAAPEVREGRTKSWNDFKVPRTRSRSASARPPVGCSPITW